MCNDAFHTVWLARVMQLILMLPKTGLSVPINGGVEQERFPKSSAAPILTDAGTSRTSTLEIFFSLRTQQSTPCG